jgi:hypothetical protein
LDEVRSAEEEWAIFETAFTAVAIDICYTQESEGKRQEETIAE